MQSGVVRKAPDIRCEFAIKQFMWISLLDVEAGWRFVQSQYRAKEFGNKMKISAHKFAPREELGPQFLLARSVSQLCHE